MRSPQPPRRPSFQTPPTPPGFQTPAFSEKRKHTVEASFDFSDAGRALKEAGNAVREALSSVQALDPTKDIDLMPLDDEVAIRKRVEEQLNKRK